jgi:hypothetical protein
MSGKSANTIRQSPARLLHVSLVLSLSNEKLAELTAQAATKVVQARDRKAKDAHDHSAVLITDAYATVAIAYRRAASAYTADKEMEQLGTAAVHLVTIANSFMNAESVRSPTEM